MSSKLDNVAGSRRSFPGNARARTLTHGIDRRDGEASAFSMLCTCDEVSV